MLYALVFCFSFTRSPTIILKGCIAMLMLVSRNMRAIKPNTIAPLTANPNDPALGSKHITSTATNAPTNMPSRKETTVGMLET